MATAGFQVWCFRHIYIHTSTYIYSCNFWGRFKRSKTMSAYARTKKKNHPPNISQYFSAYKTHEQLQGSKRLGMSPAVRRAVACPNAQRTARHCQYMHPASRRWSSAWELPRTTRGSNDAGTAATAAKRGKLRRGHNRCRALTDGRQAKPDAETSPKIVPQFPHTRS